MKDKILYRSTVPVQGYFVPAIVAEPASKDVELATTELFGPVLAMSKCQGLEEAVQMANDSPFGLSTAVFTRDLDQAMTFAHQIDAGLVRINGDTTGVDLHAPFGGFKSSSSGSREQGTVAKDFFTQWKTIQINP